MSKAPDKDELTGIDTTGHDWDGITELDNPLPRWWLYMFYASIVIAILGWIWYPSWPIWVGEWTYSKGIAGFSKRAEVTAELQRVAEGREVYYQQIREQPLEAVINDPQLLRISMAGGAAAFGDNCAACHGSGAQGFVGFPNLNDDAWLWGGTLSDIYQTLQHGIRWEADYETRLSVMQGYLADQILTRNEVSDVVDYVLSFHDQAEDEAAVARGQVTFEQICSACHGADAKGMKELGAPNLTDAIWLYGGDRATIYETVANGRAGVMPAWAGRLDDATIKQLAIYVHSLGGGQDEAN
ncbi:Cbb3-type cytochrome c oxidase subunit CcoP [Iodidimonas nitroreducens]|uniref:Cbb3-type cytochrome c oxidase subunit n=1 Tax=Iodidimonas nitroreducens TaxID=1236968 RepID=A0A5A7NBL4_9PROT|nr:cytochrome-c oxidase, cbb3-type subunit III [Iodidimonas nitroreducens]GAK33099.1 cbb3-type cytochrome c oxidase subunit CcoP [alpha proteobacterium Q-1]GER05104.1 Cbb3-type cytochrome c oxidase subunit CcoP [Iodidimonas nitroreducens]